MARTVKCIALALISIIFTLSLSLAQAQTVRAEVVASNLQNPWAVAFLPGGRFLVTERPGRLRVIEPNGEMEKGQSTNPIDARFASLISAFV